MTSIRKFLFENPFDAPPPRAVPRVDAPPPPAPEPEPPPPPVFSEAELEAVRQDAFQQGYAAGLAEGHAAGRAEGHAAGRAEGHAAGRAEAEQTTAARMSQSMVRVAEGLNKLMADRAASAADRADQPLRLGLALARKLFPALNRRHGLEEIDQMIRTCLADLIDEPRLSVRVHDGFVEEIRMRVERIAEDCGFAGRVVVIADPALTPGNCRVEWAEGGAERDIAHMLADIERIAARLFSAP